jgi:radical SAM protein with 4Fe4S-binding SPASM domain
MERASWTFNCPCKNDKIERKAGGKAPENIEDFFVRKEAFGTLYYSKSRTPVFNEIYFEGPIAHNAKYVLSSPIIAILEITGDCKLDCIQCYRPEDKKDKQLNLDTVKKLISELKEMNVVGIQYIGGEPFLHKDLFEMLRITKESGLKTEVVTSGYGVDSSTIDECSEFIDGLFVSIDGKKETHNRIRQKPESFDAAVKALREFSQKGVYATVIMTLNKLNYQDAEEVYQIASDSGARELFLKRMLRVGRGAAVCDLYLGKDDLADLVERMRKVANKRTEITYGGKCASVGGAYAFFGCTGGRSQVVVDCDGNVYRCLYIKDPSNCIGSIYSNTFNELWTKNNDTLNICDCVDSDRCGGLCDLLHK